MSPRCAERDLLFGAACVGEYGGRHVAAGTGHLARRSRVPRPDPKIEPSCSEANSGPEKRVSKNNRCPSRAASGSSAQRLLTSGGTCGNGLGDRAEKILVFAERGARGDPACTTAPPLAVASSFTAGAAQPHPLPNRIATAPSNPRHSVRIVFRILECTGTLVSVESKDRR